MTAPPIDILAVAEAALAEARVAYMATLGVPVGEAAHAFTSIRLLDAHADVKAAQLVAAAIARESGQPRG